MIGCLVLEPARFDKRHVLAGWHPQSGCGARLYSIYIIGKQRLSPPEDGGLFSTKIKAVRCEVASS